MSVERKYSRRHVIGAAGVSLFLASCEDVFASRIEKENVPEMGSVIVSGNQVLLLRNEMRYPVRDLELYLRLSGNKGKIFKLSESDAKPFLAKYPQGKLDNNFQINIIQTGK